MFLYNITQDCRVFHSSEKKKRVFDKAEMDKIGHVMTIRAKELRDMDYFISYDKASQLDSLYILQPILKHYIEEKGERKEKAYLLVYKQFDSTFEEWLKENKCVKEGNLTAEFLQILRDILRGLCCLAEDGKDEVEGTIRETFTMDSVVIVKGRGKLVNFRGATRGGNSDVGGSRAVVSGGGRATIGGGTTAASGRGSHAGDDENDSSGFKKMIEKIFEDKPKQYYLEALAAFLQANSKSKRRKRLSNIDCHPLFLGHEGRLLYLVQVKTMLEYQEKNIISKFIKSVNSLNSASWILKLKRIHDPRLDNAMGKAGEIGWGSFNFLKWIRNLIVHANEDARNIGPEEFTYQELGQLLDHLWPEFVHNIHEISNPIAIYVRVFDDFLL